VSKIANDSAPSSAPERSIYSCCGGGSMPGKRLRQLPPRQDPNGATRIRDTLAAKFDHSSVFTRSIRCDHYENAAGGSSVDCNLERSQGYVDIHLNQTTAATRDSVAANESANRSRKNWLVGERAWLKPTADLP